MPLYSCKKIRSKAACIDVHFFRTKKREDKSSLLAVKFSNTHQVPFVLAVLVVLAVLAAVSALRLSLCRD